MERLNKFLAHAGVGSRRHCEELIVRGRVSVDGAVVRELGVKVDPEPRSRAWTGSPLTGRATRLLAGQQAARLPLHQPRSGRPAAGHRSRAARPPARLHRRPARRGQRGAAAVDQRRRPGPPADAPALRRREDLPGAGGRHGPPRRTWTSLLKGVWLSDGHVKARRVKTAQDARATAPGCRSSSARARTAKSAGCWPASGTRSCVSSASPSGPVQLGRLPRGKARPLPRARISARLQAIRRTHRPRRECHRDPQ